MSDVHIVLAIQQMSRPLLDWLFLAVTFLGEETFYVLVLSWLFWCVDRRLGIRLGVLLFLSFYTCFYLKDVFQLPRPEHPLLRVLDHPEGLAFPSGHAQSSATFWFFLAFLTRKTRFIGAALVIVTMISVSRLYLGVHFPRDVLAGAALGVAFALIFLYLYAWFDRNAWQVSFSLSVIASLALSLFLFAIAPDPVSLRLAGAIGGTLVGYALCCRFLTFQAPVNLGQMAARYIPGIASVFLLNIAMRYVMGTGGFFLWLRYVILIWWVVFGVPFFFTRLERQPPQSIHSTLKP